MPLLGMYPSGRYIQQVTILNIHFNIIHNSQYVKSGSWREAEWFKSPCWMSGPGFSFASSHVGS